MARSCMLVAEVISAKNLADGLELVNTCVEVRFDGERSLTSVKEKTRQPVWNECFRFSVLNKDRLSVLSLEAYVYNVNERTNSKSLIGKVRIPGNKFANSRDEAIRDHHLESGVTMLGRSKAVLFLKVFIEDEHSDLSAVKPLNFLSESANMPRVPHDDWQLMEIKPVFESGRLVQHMPYLFVRVVKARDLPDVDVTGSLDPFVEVKAGAYKAVTKHLKKEQNPEWDVTFAFYMRHIRMCRIDVTVKDKDEVKDDFVGMMSFDQPDPDLPDNTPLPPVWHKLLDQDGRETQGELMIAIWKGSLTDKAYPYAWDSASFDMDASVLPHIRPKVYDCPTLWYVRVAVVELECNATGNDDDQSKEFIVSLSLGDKLRTTKAKRNEQRNGVNFCTWNEEFLFVVADPSESDSSLKIYVKESMGPHKDNIIGQTTISLASLEKRVDDYHHFIRTKDFRLEWPLGAGRQQDEPLGTIRLRNCLEGGYQALYDPPWRIDDIRPTASEGPNPRIGILELGILEAHIKPTKTRRGKDTSDVYCVAKYGGKWARTRTVTNSVKPVFNEQYTWNVLDVATVLTVGVFDNGLLQDSEGSGADKKDTLLGKVHIRLSYLHQGRIYAHAYPLLLLQPDNIKTMGKVSLAIRFSRTTSMLKALYSELEWLRTCALQIVATRLSQMDPPLRKEVVEHMSAAESSVFSIRKAKCSFFRLMQNISGVIYLLKWFAGVRSWRNPSITLVTHAIISLALWFHQLILPLFLLYIFFIVCWNYRFRPRFPPHCNPILSYADIADPDELDEEFDTFPTSRDAEKVKMRYDRLRNIAARLTVAISDAAVQLERIQALCSWRDPAASAIFAISVLIAAIVLYFVPYKILVAITWFYMTRPPRFRGKSSVLANFFRRLPDKRDFLL